MQNRTIFIGCSSEGLKAAEAASILLSSDGYDVMIWNQGIFGLGKSILEELITFLEKSDFAIFILRADDLITSRGNTYHIARDNVLFELGLFIGHLGRLKTFIIHDKSVENKLISDLSGIVYTSFDGSKLNLNISLGPAIARIKQQILEQIKPQETLYTEWHLGSKIYIEKLLLSKNSSNLIEGHRLYEEFGGQKQTFAVQGFQGRGFYWLEYHRPDKKGGGTIMLHDIGTGNFNGLITAGHCDTAVLRCYKNRWTLISDEQEKTTYKKDWLIEIGTYK